VRNISPAPRLCHPQVTEQGLRLPGETQGPMRDASEPVGQFFSDSWAVYEKVVEGDYLSHRSLYQGVTDFLRSRTGPLRLLELGCGDARFSLQLLQALQVEDYLGLDSSGMALDMARRRLSGYHGRWGLVQGDVRVSLEAVEGEWTVVLASFCLHHLLPAEKRSILSGIRRVLGSPGAFLLIDVFLQEGESRQAYLARRHAAMRKEWSGLSGPEIDIITEHETESDFPETVSDYQQWAQQAGFASASLSLAADNGMHSWMTLQV